MGAPALVDELLEAATVSRSREEYEATRLSLLERAIGFDALYVGAAQPCDERSRPSTAGVDGGIVARCEAQADRYWADRVALNRLALRHGGAACDREALSGRERDRMPFYREVVAAHGIVATAVSVLRAQGEIIGCLYLGRTTRSATFARELPQLRAALPALALGKRLFDLSSPKERPAPLLAALTAREREVLAQLVRGHTNAQIARRLGTSPRTVKNQVSAILAKAGASKRTELVYLAARSQ